MKKRLGRLTTFLALLLGFGLNTETPAEASKPKEEPKKSIEDIVIGKYNEKRVFEKDYSLSVAPVQAGKSTSIRVLDYAMNKDDPVERIILYEDGREIGKGANVLSKEIVKDAAGKHTYHADLIFKSGDKIKTKPIDVSFEGRPIDFAPVERWFYATTNAGKAARINVEGEDIGDNKGIEKIVLYENGQKIAESNEERINITLERPAGKFRYHAEIIDKGGNSTKTEEKEVSYLGKAFAPDIYWFTASPKKNVGKSVRILAEATDDKNIDKNSGIEKLILYENGKAIAESKKGSVFSDSRIYEIIAKENPVKCTYQIEAINKNGEIAKSDEITVNFLGKDLPPDIFWFSGRVKEEGYKANIFVDAKDDDNVANSGIKEISLYENGKIIHRENGGNLYKEIVHHEAGKYTYHAEVINNAGVKAATKPLELKFF